MEESNAETMAETRSSDSSDPKSASLTFRVENGRTYFWDAEGRHVFGDFSLKLQGELMSCEDEKQGFWVATCTSTTRGKLETKTIVLPANAFDSKVKFVVELRGRFGSGILNLGGAVTASILADYYTFLKEDLITPRPFHKAKRLGFQEYGYWLLSRELHIYLKEIVPPRDHRYFIEDNDLYKFSTILEPHLLNNEVLRSVCTRFIQLSTNFGCNEIPFRLSTAFVVYSLIKPILKTHGVDLSDESSIGLIFSKERNVGKSLTLKLLALGQGIQGSAHPLFCSGGDQNVSGVSMKVLMSLLTSTSLTTLLDDPAMTNSLSEFLLQIQSGLPQGSLRTGLSVPSGSVLMTSNSKEGDRIHGRSIRLNYRSDSDFVIENETALTKELLTLVKKNKGFLVAWVVMFFPNWLKGREQFVFKFREILSSAVPEQQPRWHKGVAGLLYTLAVFYEVATEQPIPYSTLYESVSHMVQSGKPESALQKTSFWERLKKEIEQALASSKAPLTWLNPCVNVAVSEDFVPAIGVTYSMLSGFTSIGSKETKDNLAAATDKALTSTMVFALGEGAKIGDLRKKTPGLVKKAKGYKIPKSLLGDALLHLIEYECGLREDSPKDMDSQAEAVNEGDDPLVNVKEALKDLHVLITCRPQLRVPDGEYEAETHHKTHTVIDELSPASKLRYQLMSPGKKDTFTKGILAGIRLASGDPQKPGRNDRESKQNCEIEETPITPSTSTAHVEERTAKRKLFSDGSIGLRPRSKKTDISTSEDFCGMCQNSSPPSKKGKIAKVSWIQCEQCGQWFHLFCLKMKAAPKGSWFCQSCHK